MIADRDLAAVLAQIQEWEQGLKRQRLAEEDVAERDHVIATLRATVPLRRAMETWISLRHLRTQLQGAAVVR